MSDIYREFLDKSNADPKAFAKPYTESLVAFEKSFRDKAKEYESTNVELYNKIIAYLDSVKYYTENESPDNPDNKYNNTDYAYWSILMKKIKEYLKSSDCDPELFDFFINTAGFVIAS